MLLQRGPSVTTGTLNPSRLGHRCGVRWHWHRARAAAVAQSLTVPSERCSGASGRLRRRFLGPCQASEAWSPSNEAHCTVPDPRHRPIPRRRQSSGLRLTSPTERRAIAALTLLAGAAASVAPPSPTAHDVGDALWKALFAVALVQATSRSRRWTWVYLAGCVTALAPSVEVGVFSLAALALAFWSAVADQRRRVYGALIGALCSPVLLRLDLGPGDGTGAETLLVLLLVTPVLVSGWRVAPERVRGRVRRSGVLVVTGIVAVFGGFLLAGYLASTSVSSAITFAEEGLDAARDGDAERAALHLRRAERAFGEAHGRLDAWWARPVRLVPVVAQNAQALTYATEAGSTLTGAAARTAEDVDLDALSRQAGAIDLELLATFSTPMRAAAQEVLVAEERMRLIPQSMLLPPVRERLSELERRISDVAPEAVLAADVVDIAPALLGADGPRRYLVIFVQPSEARGGGGFIGNWAELTATEGQLEMTRHGRIAELREVPGARERVLQGPADYVARYGQFNPQYWVQDVTMSPDFPSVAEVLAHIWVDAGGAPLDGVLQLDPYALAGLLELTGPIQIDGYPQRLTSTNAARVLLRDQYLEFSDRSVRADFLGEAGRVGFEALLDAPLPSPRRAADVLHGPARDGRIRFWSFHDGEHEVFTKVGVHGALPPPTTGDFLSVRHQNNANNKIDIFLSRTVRYEARVAPDTGALEAEVLVRLRNDAPTSGLPDAVIGDNDKGLPLGTNQMLLSVYTPHELRSVTIDGDRAPVSSERELGHRVYTVLVSIPAGTTAEVRFALEGKVAAGASYALTLSPQALVRPDEVVVSVQGAGRWLLRSDDLLPTGTFEGASIAGFTLARPVRVTGSWQR